jgi:putative MATE family efflux protein
MEAELTTGPVGKTLMRLTSPMVYGLLAVISLNLVDTYFIARLGTDELAAVSFTFPIVMILMNLTLGLSIGAGSIISRAVGGGDKERVKRLTTDSLVFSFCLMMILMYLGQIAIYPLFTLMNAPASLLPHIYSYMHIWYYGLPLMAVPIVGNAAINSMGDMKLPGLMMLIAAIVNLILDPLLIFGYWGFPRMEIAGAAVATLFSYGIAFCISVADLSLRKKMLSSNLKLEEMIESWRDLLKVALPASASQMIVPLTSSITVWMLGFFGPAVVAGYGIVSRLEAFSLIVVIGMATSLSAFVGQNWGAGHYQRVVQGIRIGYIFAIFWGLAIAFVLFMGSRFVPQFFNPDPEVVGTVGQYLMYVPLSYCAAGSLFVTNSYLNAIGKSHAVAVISLCRYFVLYLPLAVVAMSYFGPIGIFGVISLVNFAAGIGGYFWGKSFLVKKIDLLASN